VQWWVWLIVIVVVLGLLFGGVLALQAKRRSGGIITK